MIDLTVFLDKGTSAPLTARQYATATRRKDRDALSDLKRGLDVGVITRDQPHPDTLYRLTDRGARLAARGKIPT